MSNKIAVERFPNSHSGWQLQGMKIVSPSQTSDGHFDVAEISHLYSAKQMLRFAQLGQDVIGLLDRRAIRQAIEFGVGGDHDPALIMTDTELMDELDTMVGECLSDTSGRFAPDIRCPGDLTNLETKV